MRIAVYIDGFSFYYACFSGPTKSPFRGWKWVDFEPPCQNLFPDEEIVAVHYFTAIAPNPPDDPDQADRHANFLDALRAHTSVIVHVGKFVKSKREVALVRCTDRNGRQQTAYVWQEKKSDVALAAHSSWTRFRGKPMPWFLLRMIRTLFQQFRWSSTSRTCKSVSSVPTCRSRKSWHMSLTSPSVRQRAPGSLPATRCCRDAPRQAIHKPARWSMIDES